MLPLCMLNRGCFLQAHALTSTDTISQRMWKRAMRALDVGVEAATSPRCMVPLAARVELCTTVGHLYSSCQAAFDEDDTRQV